MYIRIVGWIDDNEIWKFYFGLLIKVLGYGWLSIDEGICGGCWENRMMIIFMYIVKSYGLKGIVVICLVNDVVLCYDIKINNWMRFYYGCELSIR